MEGVFPRGGKDSPHRGIHGGGLHGPVRYQLFDELKIPPGTFSLEDPGQGFEGQNFPDFVLFALSVGSFGPFPYMETAHRRTAVEFERSVLQPDHPGESPGVVMFTEFRAFWDPYPVDSHQAGERLKV